MANIVVLFSKIENAKNIKNILVRSGFSVVAVCTTGAQAIQSVDSLDDGILVCGYRYSDMIYSELRDYLPGNFEMLLVASKHLLNESLGTNIMSLAMPIQVHDLVSTVEMMEYNIERRKKKLRSKPKVRNEKDKEILWEAKLLLMERNNMTEEEAHRYIQKSSMDNGVNLIETAQMVLSLMRN